MYSHQMPFESCSGQPSDRFNMISVTILLLHFVMATAAPVPDIITVEFTCGATTSDSSTIKVTADRDVKVAVECKGQYKYPLVSTDKVHYTASASYSGDESTKCVFRQVSTSKVYNIDVLIGRQSDPLTASVVQFTNRHTVTCKLDAQGTKLSGSETIDVSRLPAKEVLEYKGSQMVSSRVLKVIDVKGNALASPIPVGRVVRLHAIMTAAGSETGMKALTCSASNNVIQYPILIGGCGDGIAISKSNGFTTSGTNVYSPYFTTFKLQGSNDLFFACNFTACTTPSACDGDSCAEEPSGDKTRRRRRSADEQQMLLSTFT